MARNAGVKKTMEKLVEIGQVCTELSENTKMTKELFNVDKSPDKLARDLDKLKKAATDVDKAGRAFLESFEAWQAVRRATIESIAGIANEVKTQFGLTAGVVVGAGAFSIPLFAGALLFHRQ